MTPEIISNTLLGHAQKATTAGREFMRTNPHLRLPSDYMRYPGKMDHTTILCVRVGGVEKRRGGKRRGSGGREGGHMG